MSTLRANTLKPITSGNSLVLQGDSGGSGVTGLTIDTSGNVVFANGLKNLRTYLATTTYHGLADIISTTGEWGTGATTSHTLNGASKFCIIQIFGGGGQGSRTSNPYYGGGGGGSGAYAKFLLDLEDANFATDNGNTTTLYFTLADAVGSTSSTISGEDSLFKVSTTTIITAGGGVGGAGNNGGAGGSMSWTAKSYIYKIMSLDGIAGGNGVGNSGSATTVESGVGAPNPLGQGGAIPFRQGNTNNNGVNAIAFGGGGSGGSRYGGGIEHEGGAGFSGGIIIEEYQ